MLASHYKPFVCLRRVSCVLDRSSGLVGKRYPSGDEIRYDNVNYRGTGGKDKWSKCVPVGSFEANDYGLYNMVCRLV